LEARRQADVPILKPALFLENTTGATFMSTVPETQTSARESATPGAERSTDKQGPLTITTSDLAEGVVVRLEGKADISAGDVMRFALMRLVAQRVPLAVLDLSGLIFISSLGMGILVTFRRDIGRWDGRVRIAGAQTLVLESLKAAGLTDLFDFHGTVEEATTLP
jgi:anti-anti-sigma factor